MKDYIIYNRSVGYSPVRNLTLTAGIKNLFDKDPNRVGAGQVVNIAAGDGGGTTVLNGSGSTSAAYYDVLGRRYFLNAKLRF